MLPVSSGVHGGDWIACDMVSPGMGGRCTVSIGFLRYGEFVDAADFVLADFFCGVLGLPMGW